MGTKGEGVSSPTAVQLCFWEWGDDCGQETAAHQPHCNFCVTADTPEICAAQFPCEARVATGVTQGLDY